MKLNYNLKIRVDNGYKCGCCRSHWNIESQIEIEVEDVNFYRKKSNHKQNFAKLSEEIYKNGCSIINRNEDGDENLTGDFFLSHSFYDENIETDVKIKFDDNDFKEFNLEQRWKEYREKLETARSEKSKKRRVEELESELKNLKNNE